MSQTPEHLAYLAASILRSYNVISEKQFDAMTVNSFNKYSFEYFIGNIRMRCAMKDIPEEKYLELAEKLADPKFESLFHKPVVDDTMDAMEAEWRNRRHTKDGQN